MKSSALHWLSIALIGWSRLWFRTDWISPKWISGLERNLRDVAKSVQMIRQLPMLDVFSHFLREGSLMIIFSTSICCLFLDFCSDHTLRASWAPVEIRRKLWTCSCSPLHLWIDSLLFVQVSVTALDSLGELSSRGNELTAMNVLDVLENGGKDEDRDWDPVSFAHLWQNVESSVCGSNLKWLCSLIWTWRKH